MYCVNFGKSSLLEVLVQKNVVVFRGGFHKAVFHLVHLLFQPVGYGYLLGTARGKFIRALLYGVYVASHLAVLHYGYLYGRKLARILFLERGNRARVVGVGLVHTVYENNERFAQSQAVVDYALRAYWQNAVSAYYEYCASARRESFVPLALEVVKTGQVQKVYLHSFPV